MAAVAKVIIAMEDGVIPANLHYTNPHPGIPSLRDGRMQVISENTEWTGGYVGINSFTISGVNVHCLLKSKPKELHPVTNPASSMPRLATFASRTKEGKT